MRRLSKETEMGNFMETEWYTVEYQPSTKHIKDKEIKKNTMKTRKSIKVHESKLIEVTQELRKNKITHIDPIRITVPVPLKCPECDEVGSPIITTTSRAKRGYLDYHGNVVKKSEPERWLRYNHTNGKHHRVGKYKIITMISRNNKIIKMPAVQLKKSLEKDCLHFSKRLGF